MKSTGPNPVGRKSSRARDLLFAQEEQNKHLARELHDVVSQRLAALRMRIDEVEMKPPKSRHVLQLRLRELSSRVAELAKIMHEISRQLHPSVLDDLGLLEALRGECILSSELYGSSVTFAAESVPRKLSRDVSLCLYRIAQESLRNVARHAPGAPVSITLVAANGNITLSIEDAGPGFNGGANRRKGLGLIGMKERARLVGGTLQVHSRAGKGTVVRIRVPVKRAIAASGQSHRV